VSATAGLCGTSISLWAWEADGRIEITSADNGWICCRLIRCYGSNRVAAFRTSWLERGSGLEWARPGEALAVSGRGFEWLGVEATLVVGSRERRNQGFRCATPPHGHSF